MKLTIAIPTYNRNDLLLETVRNLLPQLTEECVLLILDNCSPLPVAETLDSLLRSSPDKNIRIIRHAANIGGDANALRSFELSATEWLWVLGDDDRAQPDAIETILTHLRQHPDALYFNFSVGVKIRRDTFLTKGLAEFVEKVDFISNVLFVPSGVYKREAALAALGPAFYYAYSATISMVILIKTLGQSGICCFSDKHVIFWEPAPPERSWSFIRFGLGMMIALELPLTHHQRRCLASKILETIPQTRKDFFLQALQLARDSGEAHNAAFLYDHLCYRLYYFERNWIRRLKILLSRLMIRVPRLTYEMLRLMGVDFSKHPLRGEASKQLL